MALISIPDYLHNCTNAEKAKLMIKDGNTTILSFDNLANYIGFKYFNYVTPHNLADAFESFKAITLPDMLKAYRAYELDYNPISNYDSSEKDVKQMLHGLKTTTRTPNLTNATTHGLTQTTSFTNRETENDVTTFDSQNFRPDDRTTESGTTTTGNTGTDSTATTGTDTTTETYDLTTFVEGGNTYSGDEIEINTNTKSGNIGVTTSQQMLQSEKELRMSPILEIYLDKFINNYCFMRLNNFSEE
jgi:hypothetical protein